MFDGWANDVSLGGIVSLFVVCWETRDCYWVY